MNERPIIFSAESVRAILAGRKTQTRRVVRPDHANRLGLSLVGIAARIAPDVPFEPIHIEPGVCQWALGQRLWVKERAIIAPPKWNDGFMATVKDADGLLRIVQYLATSPDIEAAKDFGLKPCPSIFMPRWASRLTLEVTGIQVERLQAITEDDAVAEGAPAEPEGPVGCCRCGFIKAWDKIHGRRQGCRWDENPFVWVLSFRRLS